MAICPYLVLGGQCDSPFPFPSVSHWCYEATGLSIGEGEQRKYCLSKHYSLCPLFPAESAMAAGPDTVPTAAAEGDQDASPVEPLGSPRSGATPVPKPASAALGDHPRKGPAARPAEATAADAVSESVVGETAAIPAEETVGLLPIVAEDLGKAPTSGEGEASPPEVAVQAFPELAATRELELSILEEGLSSMRTTTEWDAPITPSDVGIRVRGGNPARKSYSGIAATPTPVVLHPILGSSRWALFGAAMAGLCTLVLCTAALSVYGVAQLTRVGVLSLEYAELLHQVLPFVVVSGFAAVFLFLALLFWPRGSAV